MSAAPTTPRPDAGVEHDEHAIELLRAIVDTPSVSGGERACVELLTRELARLGYRAHIDEAGNSVGQRGATDPDAPEIVLLGHIDTVPGHIPVRIEGGRLHGRGSVDAKGPLAAFAVAGALAALPPGARLVVIGAVGEEAPHSPGATFVRDRRRPAACVIGEPSGWDRCTIGYKGRLLVEAAFEQPCGHSSGPGATAPERAAAWWERVREFTASRNAGREGIFDTLQAALQRVHSASDGLTDSAAALVGFRLPTWIEPGELERRVREISADGALRCFGHAPAVRAQRSNLVAQALTTSIAAQGGRPRAVVKTGTSDMNTVARAWGCPIAAYGAGDSAMDHTPWEHIDLAQYLQSIRVLRRAIELIGSDTARG